MRLPIHVHALFISGYVAMLILYAEYLQLFGFRGCFLLSFYYNYGRHNDGRKG